jgi:hypothetical protein
MGKQEGKILVGRDICRWKDNTKMDLREIGLGGIDYFDGRKGYSERAL